MKDNRINEMLNLIPDNQTVLNVGCAQNPEIHSELGKKSRKIIGIDINAYGIKQMKKRGHDVYEMNAENIKLNGKFDYILAGEIIEHLSNPGLFIEKAVELLAPNGKLILTTPNISSILLYILVVAFDKTQDPTHVYYFDKKNLEILTDRFGLKISLTKYIPPEIKLHGDGLLFKAMFLLSTLIANLGFIFSKRLFGSYLLVVLQKNNYET